MVPAPQQSAHNVSSTPIANFAWIFKHPKLSAWTSSQVSDSKTKNRLALIGHQGHGKFSTTALLDNHLSARGSIVCSHFFGQESASAKHLSSEAREETELKKMSESIVSQLLKSRPELEAMVRPSMAAWSRKPKVTPAFAAHAPLLHWLPEFIAESQQHVYIILEGLCENIDKSVCDLVLSFLRYATELTDNVRVLVTSQSPVLVKSTYDEVDAFTNVELPKSLVGDQALAAAFQALTGIHHNPREQMARL
jgi:hypothetical protein